MNDKNDVLIIADSPLEESQIKTIVGSGNNEKLSMLCFYDKNGVQHVDGWRECRWMDFYSPDSFRNDFLNFLNDWPKRKIDKDRNVNDFFRTEEGYSLWWLGPGGNRHPDKKVFLIMRTLWTIHKAIEEIKPSKIIIYIDSGIVEKIIETHCVTIGCQFQVLSRISIKSPEKNSWVWFWLIVTLVKAFFVPVQFLINAVINRQKVEDERNCSDCNIALTTHLPRHLVRTQMGGEVKFWQAIEEELKIKLPECKIAYLMHISTSSQIKTWLYGIFRVNTDIAKSIKNTHYSIDKTLPVLEYLKAVKLQWKLAIRYAFFERYNGSQCNFLFCGIDVSLLYRQLLRKTIGQTTGWECAVAMKTMALKKAGPIKVMLVADEMYPSGMQDIAAAKRLKIPTIGVQHGTIFPMHTIYTIPQDQVLHAPLPDYFMAYGEYTRQVLSKTGNYPVERVFVTGAPRMDHLVTSPVTKQQARSQLALPQDKKIILLTTQKYPWFKTAARMLFKACLEDEDTFVCVKTHPIDFPVESYKKEMPVKMADRVQYYNTSIDLLLAACDVLVSWTSTTMLEALLLKKRIISIDLSGLPEKYPYVSQGGAIAAIDEKSLKEAIVVAFQQSEEIDSSISRFITYHLGPTSSGSAACTVVKTLNEFKCFYESSSSKQTHISSVELMQ